MIIEFLMILLISYIITGVSMYAYCVFITYSMTKNWYLKIEDGYVGICQYSPFFMWWMRSISKRMNKTERR